jgi:hypothetical protein
MVSLKVAIPEFMESAQQEFLGSHTNNYTPVETYMLLGNHVT